MTTQIQLRRGVAADWTSSNMILANGELGIETDTAKWKIGNGSTHWNSLPYQVFAAQLPELIQDTMSTTLVAGTNMTVTYDDTAGTITLTSTGGGGGGLDSEAVLDFLSGTTTPGQGLVAGTLMTLTYDDTGNKITIATTATANSSDASLRDRSTHTGTQAQSTVTGLVSALAAKADLVGGLVPTSQLPPLGVNTVFTVSSQAAMLALSASPGDMAVRTDLGVTYILAASPASTLGNWVALSSGAAVSSVAGKTGTVVLVKADVGLSNVDNTSDVNKPISTATQAALDNKLGVTDAVDSNNLTNDIPQDVWPSGGSLVVDYVKSGGVHGSANAWPSLRPAVDEARAKGPAAAGPPTWLLDGDDYETVG